MFWPTNMLPGTVLLLSEGPSFNAAYIQRTLQFWGVTATARPVESDRPILKLEPAEVASIIGCIAVDLDDATLGKLALDQWPFPFLFVGGSGAAFPGPHEWMQAPFASYQVLDRLLNLMRIPPV